MCSRGHRSPECLPCKSFAELRGDPVGIVSQPFVGDVHDEVALGGQTISTPQVVLPGTAALMMRSAVDLNDHTETLVDEINPSDEPGLVVNRNLPVRHGKTKAPQKLDEPGFECAFRGTTGVMPKN